MAQVNKNPDPMVSHGRGGAANLSRDDTPYADAGIVRERDSSTPVTGSTGRGGQGNMAPSPRVTAMDRQPSGKGKGVADESKVANAMAAAPGAHHAQPTAATNTAPSADSVPELSIQQAPNMFHVGRGGEGNALYENNSKITKEGNSHKKNGTSGGADNDNNGGQPAVHHHEGAAQRFKEMLLGKEGKP